MGAFFGAILAALLKRRQAQAAQPAPATIPAGPAPKLESALSNAYSMIRRKRTGRSGTILTGDLEPMDLGKRTLLG